MKLSTWKELRKQFPALRGETTASYLQRLSKWLNGVTAEWGGFER